MSIHILSRYTDARRAAKLGLLVSGVIEIRNLARLASMVANDEGFVKALLRFSTDDLDRNIIDIEASCELKLQCQRCLEIIEVPINCVTRLALVTDESSFDFSELPDWLEPLVAEEPCDTWKAVEDEIILKIPSHPVHLKKTCNLPELHSAFTDFDDTLHVDRHKPFKELSTLLSNKFS